MRFRHLSAAALLALSGLALAGTVAGNFSQGSRNNTTTVAPLSLLTVENEIDGWIRRPHNALDWEAQLQKDDATFFSSGDRCLRDAENTALDGPTEIVLGGEYRTGPVTKNFGISPIPYVATLPTGSVLTMPVGLSTIDAVTLLTGGSRIAQVNYTVTFSYDDSTVALVLVPVPVDTVLGAARDGVGGSWLRTGFSAVHHASPKWDKDGNGSSDCAGGGADEILIDNPFPSKGVDTIAISYTSYTSVNASFGWLGGPLALSLVTTEDQIESTFTYRGEYISPSSTASALNAGSRALWYQMSWLAEGIDTDSEILVHVTCGTDSSANGNIDASEQAPEKTYTLSQLSSPAMLAPICSGQYLLYRVEIIDAFLDAPALDEISFHFDIDTDGDGFGAAGLTGIIDCNDTNPLIHPASTENIGDGIDSDCNALEICYRDADNDGTRSLLTVVSSDADCLDVNEGAAIDPIDCNDANALQSPLLPETTGDGIDNNCDGIIL